MFLDHLDATPITTQPRTDSARPEAGDRRRQDDRDGDVHRLADDQRGAPPEQQAVHARISRRHPGITIRDRLRVLQPNDPDSYYASRELVPPDMLGEIGRRRSSSRTTTPSNCARRIELSKGGRALLQGAARSCNTLETEGQMLQRVMPELMGMKNIMVINDEAHHCYREKPATSEERTQGRREKEAEENKEAARLWITGLEIVNRKLGVARVFDLSATPFFLSGSGYAEGTLFPWTMSDFSLMDAIECGIVKLPRVPVADNIPAARCRSSATCGSTSARRCRRRARQGNGLDPLSIPVAIADRARGALRPLRKTFELWEKRVSRSRRASSWSATTPRRPSSSTTTSPGSTGRTMTDATTFEDGRLDAVPKLRRARQPARPPRTPC